LGGVNGSTVSDYSSANVQILSLHSDISSEAQKDWNELMNLGVVYADIKEMTTIRRRRIESYLDSIAQQINAVVV
ncbi:MAG: hypothetical protein ACKOEV_04725, partial [Cytophagales bacterium]